MRKNLDSSIARFILLAQVASDGGKGITCIKDIMGNKSCSIWKQGYSAKDWAILEALGMIARSKKSRFRYFVKSFDKYSGIVYFQYKDSDGFRRQVSFHTFCKEVIRYATLRRVKGELQQQGKSCRFITNWDRKSSRDTAVHLAEEFIPNELNPQAVDHYWGLGRMAV